MSDNNNLLNKSNNKINNENLNGKKKNNDVPSKKEFRIRIRKINNEHFRNFSFNSNKFIH